MATYLIRHGLHGGKAGLQQISHPSTLGGGTACSWPGTGRRHPPKYPPPNFQFCKRDLLELGLACGPENKLGLACGPENKLGLACGPENKLGLACGPENKLGLACEPVNWSMHACKLSRRSHTWILCSRCCSSSSLRICHLIWCQGLINLCRAPAQAQRGHETPRAVNHDAPGSSYIAAESYPPTVFIRCQGLINPCRVPAQARQGCGRAGTAMMCTKVS
ncbi:hypothetical protein DUNSADRAFT_1339 [Dunaliella salina]|uniref:Encoded protein n=1 Tax=Dunaliella salina TaxID=3046 RepID=A0ABQ7GX69_DUNSA|nr:hypothetical protein DUNSADRAFT_1339 [Dunaliella salina]|eukprot:KAF5839203.1 hypothetical protein DUNSADRAFT_1339 [Dunaliella salina]